MRRCVQSSTRTSYPSYSALTRAGRFGLAYLIILAAASGCGDDKRVARGGGPSTDTSTAIDAEDSLGGDTVNPNDYPRELIVLHDTSRPLQLTVTETRLLRVKVVDYQSSGPAADTGVKFAIVGGGDQGEANLTSGQAYTDGSGVAGVTFRSRTSADVTYTVEVTTNGAAPVRFDVLVADAPRGDLRVALQYEGPIAIKNVHVRLMPGTYTCSQFSAVNPPQDILAEKTLLGVGHDEVTWTDLPDGQRFTIFATADSQSGGLAAAGCLDGVVVLGEQENTVTLTMFMLVLNPTGNYDSTSVFDFTGAIPGQVGQLVDEIGLLFTSPGQFLINQVKKIAALYVGELITNAVFGLFEDAVADVIDDWMFNNSPDWLQDILQVGADLFQVVNNLEMLATLKISKLNNDYYVQGRLLWDGIVLYWHWGCADVGEPGYDPDCGKNVFGLADFTNTQFPMDIIEGRFTATIQDFDQLDIANHTIKLNYGKLIIFVLNEMILPALSGQHTLHDAILSFVNCAAIADGIGGFSLLGISEQDVEDFCVDGITLVVTPVEILLSNLALDSQLRMQGIATLEDETNDLRVDRIIDGQFQGNFESDGQQGAPFTATWSAVKKALP